ncbi:hypothetical protein C8Q70DRAFT_1057915 [Cubamyces menziesii]|nr:hypothetical protein C8Q70DRAFT_1057915 [Cubamyces menziesii]
MTSTLNVSSVILKTYPEVSPWELDGVCFIQPLSYRPITPFPEDLYRAALVHAQKTGLNPFYIFCSNNPFVLDVPNTANSPLRPPTPLEAQSMPKVDFSETITLVDIVRSQSDDVVCRILVAGTTRVLKLFLGRGAAFLFDNEIAAYTRFRQCQTAASGAVLQCFGWAEVDTKFLKTVANMIPSFADAILAHGDHNARGILLEDLPDSEILSIKNITPAVADRALRALQSIHAAFVLHGSLDRDHIVVVPSQDRVVWENFSHSTSYGRRCGDISRKDLLAELAQAWDLLYRRLYPDSIIGYDANADTIDPQSLCDASSATSMSPSLPRAGKGAVNEEAASIILTYPEINYFSWDTPLLNLTPAPRHDDRLDTPELLQAAQAAYMATKYNPFANWYGTCPVKLPMNNSILATHYMTDIENYKAPTPLPQLLSSVSVEFREHINPSGNNPLMKVRIDGRERLLKIFSSARRQGPDERTDPKLRFEAEREAYAHLGHYGGSAAGAVPRCFGWFELSSDHVYGAIDIIRRTRARGFDKGKDPVWVFPIFDDGTPAVALILEYISNAETLSMDNITLGRADLTMRSLSRVHCSYVQHGDCDFNLSNILLVREGDSDSERIVFVDFDHAFAGSSTSDRSMCRMSVHGEFTRLWGQLYNVMLPLRRLRGDSSSATK